MASIHDQIRQRFGSGWLDREVDDFAKLLSANGISDLSALSFERGQRKAPDSYDAGSESRDSSAADGQDMPSWLANYGGKRIGFLGDVNRDGSWSMPGHAETGQLGWADGGSDVLGWSATGKGNTSFRVVDGLDGRPTVVPVWGSGRAGNIADARAIAYMIAAAAGAAYAPDGGATGNIAQGAVKGQIAGTAGGLATDQDPIKTGLAGAATGAVSGGIKGYGAEQGWSPATTKAVSSATNAALRGGSVGDIAKAGLLSGATGSIGGIGGQASDEAARGSGMSFDFDTSAYDNQDFNQFLVNNSFDGSNVQFDPGDMTRYDFGFDPSLIYGQDGQIPNWLTNAAKKFLTTKDKNGNDALNPLLPMVLGGMLGAKGGKDQQATSSRAPWEPAQPYLKGLLAEGADLYGQYKAQPFSQAQQSGYRNVGGLLDLINANAPGLMSGFQANASGANQFQRGRPGLLRGSTFAPTTGWSPYLFGDFGTGGK